MLLQFSWECMLVGASLLGVYKRGGGGGDYARNWGVPEVTW